MKIRKRGKLEFNFWVNRLINHSYCGWFFLLDYFQIVGYVETFMSCTLYNLIDDNEKSIYLYCLPRPQTKTRTNLFVNFKLIDFLF